MTSKLFFLFLLLLSIFIEATLLPYPFFFLFSGLFFLLYKDNGALLIILLFSIFLDASLLSPIPLTAVFIFSFLCVFLLLEHIFSFQDMRFTIVVLFIGAEVFRIFMGYPFIFLLSFFVLMGLLVFTMLSKKSGVRNATVREDNTLHI